MALPTLFAARSVAQHSTAQMWQAGTCLRVGKSSALLQQLPPIHLTDELLCFLEVARQDNPLPAAEPADSAQ